MGACRYFGIDLRNQLDHKFPSRLTGGTPYSSSDLLSSSLLLLVQIILTPTCPLTPASVLGCEDSVDELRSDARVKLNLQNPHDIPQNLIGFT